MPLLIVLAITTSASAATVVSFVAVRTGETLIVSNPQGSTVTGEIRLVPDAGTAAMPARTFSLPSQGSQAFPNVLSTFGTITSPAIIAVESSDAVTLSSSPLRVGYPERHLMLPVRFNPSTPATGSLILGILSGLVRVSIYEHPTSVTPIVTRTFGSSGEQVTRLRYADLLPAGLGITDGYAAVMPLGGQVVGTVVNPPIRRRSVGSGRTSPPVLSVTGGPACEFATGVRASVPAAAGATYRWTLLNATAQGSLTGNAVDVALGSSGFASFALERTVNGAVTSAEVNVRIEAKPVYTSTGASSVTLGQDATIEWTLAGSAPTSQTISGTDISTVSLDRSATSYTYRPTTEGTKSYALSADNACGGSGASGDYSVSAACTSPTISNFTIDQSPVCPGAGSTMRFSIANATSWSLRSALGNGFVQPSGAGTGSLTSTYVADNSAGNDIVTLTVVGCGSATVTRTLNVTVPTRPAITSFTTPATVAPGMGGTIAFTYTNGTSFAFTSSLDNTFTPSGGNSTTGGSVNYNRDNAAGPDTITLRVMGPCETTSQTRVINDAPPVISSFTTNHAAIGFGGTATLHFAIQHGSTWSLSSSIGNGFSQSSGTGSGPFAITYSASFDEGTDTVTLTVTGPGGSTSATVTITVNDGPPPGASSFTISKNPIPFGGSATISFTIADATSWGLTSTLGNSFSTNSGTGSGSFNVEYSADNAVGTDTVTLTLHGPGGMSTVTLHPVVN